MDQSEADWGDWSLNNDGGVNQLDVDIKHELLDDEQRLTAYDEEPQKEAPEFCMYDDEAGMGSGSGESEGSDLEDMEEGSELQKELLSRTERGPLGLLQPQGMVMCEFCGRLGVRDAFYSKTKRFCSVNCSKSFASAQKDGKPTPFTLIQASMAQAKPKGGHGYLKSQYISQGGIKFGSGSTIAFDWSCYMNQNGANAAPVSCFKHCLMSDSWDNIAVGMKVEVLNTDCELQNEAYWIATVIQLAGYRAQMRYEGFGNDATLDFWMNLCTKDIHPVGWCAASGKPLVPPKTIQHKYLDWKDFLVKRLTGARTLPQNFYSKVQECLNNTPIKTGMFVEVVDKICVSAMRVARVEEIIGGRLRLHYVDSKVENDEFWCHQESPLVHHVGWSQLVGHKLNATNEYKAESMNKVTLKKYSEMDSTPDMFPKNKDVPAGGKFQIGMKLEAIDPLNLSSVCVATVQKVLRNSYLMIGIDGSVAQSGTDWFCYHATSPCIFPVGFCEINNLEITPPRGFKGPFKWFDYLKQTKSAAAPVKLFDKVIPRHGFKFGMKLEAVDLMEPRLICVATVRKVIGRLLCVHFDGWEDSYDQWIDCHSADIYPVGWCEMVGYHLEGPRATELTQPHLMSLPKKRKSKSQIYRGPRKKRKPKMLLPPARPGSRSHHQNSLDSSDISQDSFSTATSDTVATAGGVGLNCSGIKDEVVDPSEEPMEQGCGLLSSSADEVVPQSALIPSASSMSGIDLQSLGDESQKVTASTPISKSLLASSSPSIANMLNSPVQSHPGAGTLCAVSNISNQSLSPQLKTAGIGLKSSTASTVGTLSPSSSPSSHVFTVQKLQGQSPVYSLAAPGSPGASTMHVAQVFTRNIPRLVPGEPEKDCLPPIVVNRSQAVSPEKWNVFDVCQFLRINDCGAHCESFRKKNTDGQKFLALTKEQIVNLTGMKVGPSLKIHDLIQALKAKVAQQSPSKKAELQQQIESPGSGSVVTSEASPQEGKGSSAQVTASVLLKQQGLLQPQQQVGSSSQDNRLLTQHLLKGTSRPSPNVQQHSISLKAQLTQ